MENNRFHSVTLARNYTTKWNKEYWIGKLSNIVGGERLERKDGGQTKGNFLEFLESCGNFGIERWKKFLVEFEVVFDEFDIEVLMRKFGVKVLGLFE